VAWAIAIQLAKGLDVEVTGVDRAAKLETMGPSASTTSSRKRTSPELGNARSDSRHEDQSFSIQYLQALTAHGTYIPRSGVGGRHTGHDLRLVDWATTNKTVQLIGLKQNKDLAYLNERFEAGQLMPVISPYKRATRESLRHFGAANHKGKVVITMGELP
jgi:hypothetical protein